MTMLAIGTTVAGGAMQASSSIKGAKADRQVADYNARIRERNKEVFEQEAKQRKWIAGRQAVALYSDGMDFITDQQVQYSKAGVAAGTGTPFIVAMEMVDRLEDKMRALEYNSEVESAALREQGVNAQMDADLIRVGGRARAQARKIQAVTSLLNTAGSIGMHYA